MAAPPSTAPASIDDTTMKVVFMDFSLVGIDRDPLAAHEQLRNCGRKSRPRGDGGLVQSMMAPADGMRAAAKKDRGTSHWQPRSNLHRFPVWSHCLRCAAELA